ncbi:MAG: hypothetical protein A2020_05795 [Lentisphaerae bacterium GWF2_45_14]|nr:MAG: hypothetical protein A2020_05795 [Lentisphaerae bacterium GWF2_45_14]
MKILVVDDDECIRATLKDAMESLGHEVSCASNGIEALEQYRKDKPDIAIIDIIMPRKEGIETILELSYELHFKNIIAMTGGGMISAMNYLEMAKKAGVFYAMKKPFAIAELTGKINEMSEKIYNDKLSLSTSHR